MTNQLINTTVTWLRYNDNFILEDQALKDDILIIRENKIPIKEYKQIYKSVGSKYNWIGRLKISESELLKIIHNNCVEIYLMKKNKKTIGFLEIDYRSSNEIKIVHLGIIENYIGKGYGREMLYFAIKRAKRIGIKPLILQTNSLDHPNALIFYQKNGFEVYSRRNAKVIKDKIDEK